MQNKLFDDPSFFESKKEIKPFVKWVGGKTQIIKELLAMVPKNFNHYYEPFIGGGALFFKLQPKEATISDLNFELISAYKCFNKNTKFNNLVDRLKEHRECPNLFVFS